MVLFGLTFFYQEKSKLVGEGVFEQGELRTAFLRDDDGYNVEASPLVPWDNIDQIKITFDQGVNVWESDLSLSGVNTTAYTFSDFNWDGNTNSATWTLSSALAKDKIFLDLDADGLHSIKNIYGDELDGDADGYGGDDYELRFDVLPGDADLDGTVEGAAEDDDYQIVGNIGLVTTDAGYSV